MWHNPRQQVSALLVEQAQHQLVVPQSPCLHQFLLLHHGPAGGSGGAATDQATPLANATAYPPAQPSDIPITTNDGNTDSGSEQQGAVTNGGSAPAVGQTTADDGFNDAKDKKPRHVKKEKKPKDSKDDSGSGGSPPSQADASLGTVLGAVVVQHNTYRARHGVPALSWNSTLASSAQALAGIVAARGCAPQYPGYYINGPGANIAFGFWDFSAVVQAWYDEGLHYDYTADSYNFATWDFTQLVWKSTTSLGCVVSPCARGPVHVCVYYPPGNIAGQVTKNVFEPTS